MQALQLRPSTTNRFTRLSKRDGFWNQVLHETAHFVVLPTLGMLVEGWLLIVPKKEHLNFGQLSSVEIEDYRQLTDYLHEFYRACYSEPVVFEHGPAMARTSVGCGVDYAHRHIVPLDFSLIGWAKELVKENWVCAPDSDTIQELAAMGVSYLHIRESGFDWIAVGENIGSQVLRKVIAVATSQSEKWDWKQYHFESNIESTIQAFENWKTGEQK
jgi:ATP adenylyltransferase